MQENQTFLRGKSREKIVEMLQGGECNVQHLNYEETVHRAAFFDYVSTKKPNLLAELKGEHEEKFLEYCIKRKPELFVYLTPSQYSQESAGIYLNYKITKVDGGKDGFITRSLDGKIVFNERYETCDGEQIFYYDCDLRSQLYLVAKLEVSFKTLDAVKLLKKWDVDIRYIGYNTIHGILTDWINSAYRKVVLGIVGGGKSGIYQLNGQHERLEKEIADELTKAISDGGLEVKSVKIKKLSLVEETEKLLEKCGLENLLEKRRQEMEIDYEKAALENYAQKAKIHTENPTFAPTLTEAEKDSALARYLRKTKYERGVTEEVAVGELKSRVAKKDGVVKKAPDLPVLKKKTMGFVWWFILAVTLFVVGFINVENVGLLLILFGFGALSLGLGIFYAIGYATEDKAADYYRKEYEAQLEELEEMKKNGGLS